MCLQQNLIHEKTWCIFSTKEGGSNPNNLADLLTFLEEFPYICELHAHLLICESNVSMSIVDL